MRCARFLVAFSSISVLACAEADTSGPGNDSPAIASVVVTPSTATFVSLADTVRLTASAKDASGNTVSNPKLTWSSTDESVASVSSSGLVMAVAEGAATITASSNSVISNPVAVTVAQAAAALVFTAQPTEVIQGFTISPAVEVTALDALGNVVSGFTGAVTVAIGTNPGGGTLSGTTTAAATAGVVAFAGLSVDNEGTGYDLNASAPGVMVAVSGTFDVTSAGPFVYVSNVLSDDVSVISTATNTVVATVGVGPDPVISAITPDGALVYVANDGNATVSVISTATNAVVATIGVHVSPRGAAITPDGTLVYQTNYGLPPTVSVISTATNMVVADVGVSSNPIDPAITPDGALVYVAHAINSLSVISTATNTVVATVGVGNNPRKVVITPMLTPTP